jgi:hypothetical protein
LAIYKREVTFFFHSKILPCFRPFFKARNGSLQLRSAQAPSH